MTNQLPLLQNLDIRDKVALVRLDANVPVRAGRVLEGFRLERARSTLDYLYQHCRRVILISHIENEEGRTLEPIAEYLNQYWPVRFIADWQPEDLSERLTAVRDRMVLLENLRFFAGEKKNELKLAEQLARSADLFVNEAFAVAHRSHASIVSLPRYLSSAAGFLFQEEVKHLTAAFKPARPFLFILGGAKFSTKLPLIEKFIDRADTLFVGGALANVFFREQGLDLGRSLVEEPADQEQIKSLAQADNLLLPQDVVAWQPERDSRIVKQPAELEADEIINDAGPATLDRLKEEVARAATVVWNGPLGDYLEGFCQPTEELARALADSPAETTLGGGDTVAAISKLGLLEQYNFVSTGGGAMLEFLAKETLPGIEAMQDTNR